MCLNDGTSVNSGQGWYNLSTLRSAADEFVVTGNRGSYLFSELL